MTDFAALLQPDRGQPAISLSIVDKAGFPAWLKAQAPRARTAVAAQQFKGAPHQLAILPGDKADQWSVVAGVADAATLGSWCLAKAAAQLPEGSYRIADNAPPGPAMLGWLLAQYAFDRYRKDEERCGPRILLTPDAQLRGVTPSEVLRDAVESVAVPLPGQD